MKLLLFIFLLYGCIQPSAQTQKETQAIKMKKVEKNGMIVQWEFKNERIYIEMSAPTDGWVAIGFNTSDDISGNYLLMGNVIDGEVSVVEHYTFSPGNYQSFGFLKEKNSVFDIEGFENQNITNIKFSLPITGVSNYAKNLSEGNSFTLLMAYSQEDDFKHHSIMRTAILIKL